MDLVLTGQIIIGWTLEKSTWHVMHSTCNDQVLMNCLISWFDLQSSIKQGVLADSLKSNILSKKAFSPTQFG